MSEYEHPYDALELDPVPSPPSPRRRVKRDTEPMADPAAYHAPPTPEALTRDLATTEAKIAADHGFQVGAVDSGLLFDAGTRLADVGIAKLEEAERQYLAMPTVGEASKVHAERIAAEQRNDAVVPLSRFRIDPMGDLRAWTQQPARPGQPWNGGWGSHKTTLSTHAFGQLAVKCGTSNVNAVLGSQGEARLRTRRAYDVDPDTGKLALGDRRETYALVSAGNRAYVPFDTDKLLAEAAAALPECRATVTYDEGSTTMRARIIAQAPIDIPEFNGVGRVHRLGLDLWSADNGTMSIRVNPFLIRVRCKNATLVTHGHTGRRRFRHVGSMENVRAGVTAALETASQAVAEFRALWAAKAQEWYLDPDGARLPVPEALRRLVLHGHLPKCGLSESEAVDAYTAAWNAEPVESAMGLVMAVQRAAHEVSWKTRWADEDVEEAATELLYQRVFVLDAA